MPTWSKGKLVEPTRLERDVLVGSNPTVGTNLWPYSVMDRTRLCESLGLGSTPSIGRHLTHLPCVGGAKSVIRHTLQ